MKAKSGQSSFKTCSMGNTKFTASLLSKMLPKMSQRGKCLILDIRLRRKIKMFQVDSADRDKCKHGEI